jgi:hypothetical protein
VRLKIVSNSGGLAISVTTIYLEDPSVLNTLSNMVSGSDYGVRGLANTYLQARLLTDPNDLSPANIGNALTVQLTDLVNKLHQDFDNNISAQTGYAILSYLDPTTQTIRTTVLEVLQS